MLSRRAILFSALGACAPAAESPLTDAQMEEFLLQGAIVRTRATKMGITGSVRATMKSGDREHDIHIQTIDESKSQFQGSQGVELNFRDSWRYNVAGYRLDRLLGLNRTPVSVARRHEGREGAFTWWIDDVLMVEMERFKKKVEAPDKEAWNRQMQIVRVFDQLIYNTDRNLQNLIITKDWKLWMIDHTRAFRMHKECKDPKVLKFCEKGFYEKLKALDQPGLAARMERFLTASEIQGLLARRDHVVRMLDRHIAAGDKGVLYSL